MAGVYYCAMHGCDIPDDVLTWITVGFLGFIVVTAVIGTIIDRRKK